MSRLHSGALVPNFLSREIGNRLTFKRLCDAMGQPVLLNKDHFETDAKRRKNATELKKFIEAWLSTMKVSEVLKIRVTMLGLKEKDIKRLKDAKVI
jgi:crotonobetainyl-CoA:carnitine CoA-transferase CaiB-like acyl-CoA transferase